jgi:hypothetical protein
MARILSLILSLAIVLSVRILVRESGIHADWVIAMGRTNERIARNQEVYVANATNCWLESLERSLVMMKEYQARTSRA